ncbi:MAG: LCP family protein [Acidimicrobiia bacterium]|nr:LCP family protein [Acidimicrobiia bacterium]MDH5292477.1 LCP family protein [Acidimicrobiia bacterium]
MEPTSPKPRRRAVAWLKRILIAVLVLANLAVFYVYWQLRAVEGAVQETAQAVAEVVPELTPTMPGSSEPITFLLVGSDSRANLDSTEGFGVAGGERSDVIMLVKLHPDDGRAQILSLPRDLWVDIPGHGDSKINAAYSLGGAPLLVQTVKAITGVSINHYVEVDFVGFQSIVDQLGGVAIDFPYAARDRKSKLAVDAGLQTLDGEQALAYARSRSYQELRDGRWVSVDADDFGRTARQQKLILAILDGVSRPSSLTDAAGIVGSFTQHVSMDAALVDSSIIELAFRMRAIRGDLIETATLPGVTDSVGAQSVVRAEEPEASAVLSAFRNGTSLALAISEGSVAVTILNGNGLSGNATHWSDVLGAAGFVIGDVGDADRSTYEQTLVTVRVGEGETGDRIVAALGFGTIQEGSVPADADAVIVLGADAAGNAG